MAKGLNSSLKSMGKSITKKVSTSSKSKPLSVGKTTKKK
jgi:hypothetical protein